MLQKPNYRRHGAYEPVQSAKPAQSAIFAAKMLPNLQQRATGLIVWDQPKFSLLKSARITDWISEETYLRVASKISSQFASWHHYELQTVKIVERKQYPRLRPPPPEVRNAKPPGLDSSHASPEFR
jgi:hypothetical protein